MNSFEGHVPLNSSVLTDSMYNKIYGCLSLTTRKLFCRSKVVERYGSLRRLRRIAKYDLHLYISITFVRRALDDELEVIKARLHVTNLLFHQKTEFNPFEPIMLPELLIISLKHQIAAY